MPIARNLPRSLGAALTPLAVGVLLLAGCASDSPSGQATTGTNAGEPISPAEGPATDAAPFGTDRVIDRVITSDGLVLEDLMFGPGELCMPGHIVTVHYVARLEDGTVFDDTYPVGPTTFALEDMIRGFRKGLPGMRVGGKRRLTIPPELAFGDTPLTDETGAVLIPGGSTVVFEVLLLNSRQPDG